MSIRRQESKKEKENFLVFFKPSFTTSAVLSVSLFTIKYEFTFYFHWNLPFIKLKKVSSIPNLRRVFYHEWVLSMLSLYLFNDNLFSFFLFILWNWLINCLIFNLAFLGKTPFDVVFIYFLVQVANVLLRIFASVFLKKTGLPHSSSFFSPFFLVVF